MASRYSLLINFEHGAVRDSSPQSHTIVQAGTPVIDTSIKKFGAASGLFNQNTDTLTVAEHDTLNLGAGDFTIDFWLYIDDTGYVPVHGEVTYGADSDNELKFQISAASQLKATITDATTEEIDVSGTVSMVSDTWHHLAFVRSGNDWSIYFDGTRVDTQSKSYTVPDFGSSNLVIKPQNSGTPTNKYIDSFRILKGHAAWTGASFTVPTRPYLEFIEEGIVQRLLNDVGVFALTGTRIYPNLAPTDATFPYIVYRKISAKHEQDMDGPAGLVKQRVELNMWDDDISGVRVLAKEVQDSMVGYKGYLGDLWVQSILIDDESTDFIASEDSSVRRMYGVGQDYNVWHKE